jgi:phosphate starvation-inducible PhoH-like protein
MLPRTVNQRLFIDLLKAPRPPIVFASGPAGTGKTLVACHVGAEALAKGRVQRLIITRPAVSVDEQHGFLPGTLEQKMDPWTRPVFDALRKFYTPRDLLRMTTDGIVEVCPLAYMRGRTFDNAWIIADEMQNATPSQMRMVMTRIGNDSKLVITGDPAQHDRGFERNGLIDFTDRLVNKPVLSIQHIRFDESDVVRHPVIRDVLDIYDHPPMLISAPVAPRG